MKTYKHLWEQLIELNNFEQAARRAIKGKRRQWQVIQFKADWDNNVRRCRDMVALGNWQPSPYTEKRINYPKQRTVYVLPLMPDRVVHHAIMNILRPIMTKLFIEDSYACIEGRGQVQASLKCSEIVRKYDWILQLDIRKFFPSIEQQLLSDMLHVKIKDDRFMKVVDSIIFSYPGGKNVPIGNYTSQWFGNYFITVVDNYIKHTLKCRDTTRYCDDIIIGCDSKQQAHERRVAIEKFLYDRCHLTLSYAEVYKSTQGVDFCGYRHFGKYNLLRKSTATHQQKSLKHIQQNSNKYTADEVIATKASIRGHDCHACTYNFIRSLHLETIQGTKE